MRSMYTIDAKMGVLLNKTTGQYTNLGKHELNLLTILLNNHGVAQNQEILLADAWEGKVVARSSLTKAICTLRAVLQDKPPYRIIINIPREGYYLKSSCRALFSITT